MTAPLSLVARLAGVTLHYHQTVALEDVRLDLPAACIIGLIGPDGVGKSSLLALIAGARRAQCGVVETLGESMTSPRQRERACPRIAYMPQGLGRNLYASLSVTENLDFFGRLFGLERSARALRIAELLEATGLAAFPDRAVGQLSGGMKQKLGLCCALIHDPDLLILDEPTTGIDPLSRRQFWELIGQIRSRRPATSVIVATAYFDEAERFDWLVAMNAGRVLAVDTPERLKARCGASRLEHAYARLMGATEIDTAQVTAGVSHGQTASSQIAINARGLTRWFGDFLAVDHVDLAIARGEIFGFVGPNGCGKTTTIKMLTGLLPASEGQATLFGRPVDARDLALRARVGFMSQSFSLYTELTVRQNLVLHGHLFHLSRERLARRLAELVSDFGLAAYLEKMTEHLPLGVRQRLSLAVAVIHEPDLLILDEPTSGVDPVARDRFWQLLTGLARRRGVTIFVSTHFMNEAERCDRLSLMYEGRVLAQGPPAEIMRRTRTSSLEEAFIAHIERVSTSRRAPATQAAGFITARAGGGAAAARPGLTFGRLWAYARRELMELRRDPIRLAFAFLGPVILMLVFGFGITFDVEHLAYAALDYDQSPESREYLESFSSSRYFSVRPLVADAADLELRMRSGELRLVVEVPPDFGRDLRRGRSPEVAVWLDGAFPFRAETTRGYVEGVHQAFLQRLARESPEVPAAGTPADIQARFRYNQAFLSVYAIVPGTIMLLLLFMPAIMTALGVVREKELGSIVNFYVTPTTKLEFLLGKQLPYVGIALINFAALLALAIWVFQVPVKGSLTALVLGAFIYVVSSTAFGLMVSNFVRTQIAAIFATAIVTTIPAIQYSGYLLPVSSMSADAQAIGRAFASSYFLHLSLGTFTKALGFSSVALDLAALVVIAVIVTALARAALPAQER
jgi:ribosome-dependent ATPase